MKYKPNPVRALAATLIIFESLAAGANAAVVINVNQNGSDVQIVGTGSLDLNSTVGAPAGISAGHNFNARNRGVSNFFVGVFPVSSDQYSITNLSIIGAIDTSSPGAPNIGGDPTQGLFVNSQNGGLLFVPAGYISDTSLDFAAFITDYDYTDYGFSAGDSITVSWSNGAVNESLTMNFGVVPEPSSIVLLGGVAILVATRRTRQN